MTYPNLSRALNGAVPFYPSGSDYRVLSSLGYFSVKNDLGVLTGVNINTLGAGSSMELFDGMSSTITVTIATPGVVTWLNHPLVAGDAVRFTTTGALPTGLVAGTTYYVSITDLTMSTFKLSDTYAHALAGTDLINTSGTQSGVHTGWDVTRSMGIWSTIAVGHFTIGFNGAKFGDGLIAVVAGGTPPNVTITYL